jgi:hypothetical protein
MRTWQDNRDSGFDFQPTTDGWIPTFPGDLLDEISPASRFGQLDGGDKPLPRRGSQVADVSVIARVWLDNLPDSARPTVTSLRHPHIVNKFAVIWCDTARVRDYFEELLLDTRQGRQGFAHEVLNELGALLDHFDAVVLERKR